MTKAALLRTDGAHQAADQAAGQGAHQAPPTGRPGPARGRWEWLLWLLAGLGVALALTWPLATRLTTVIPQDVGDPLAQAWTLAFGGHALFTAPGSLFQGNVFFGAPNSLAFTDSLLGYAPTALVGEGPVAAVVRYNLVLLTAYALAFAAAALLARELRCRPAAAAVAGFAFAWAPWRIAQNGHLNVISTGGVALTLFLLLSGYRRGRAWQVLAGWAVAAWQLSLGFALGIWFAYFLALLAGLALVVWLRRGRPALPRALLVATGAGGLLVLATTAFLARPYLAIVTADPGALRSREDVAFYSPPLRSLLAAADQSRAWGEATGFVRATLPWVPEQTLFPGLAVLVLAVLGLRWRGATRGLRIGLAVGTALTVLLGFGLSLWGGVLYEPLFRYAPGWDGLRTPGRLALFWSLGLAVLAAMGAERIAGAVTTRLARLTGPAGSTQARLPVAGIATALVLVLAAVVAYEGAPRLPLAEVPLAPAGLAGVRGPLLNLPSDGISDTRYMLWSTAGFVPIGNGSSGYTPTTIGVLRTQTVTFPDAGSVQLLRSLGYRTVAVHRALVAGTAWQNAADAAVDGLGIVRRDLGDVVLFDL